MTTPVKRKRGEGQWALGYREPLNPNERTKKDDDGLNVRARIENIYAKRGLRLASTRPTCAAGCAGGASTPSASPASTAAAPRVLEPRRARRRVLHAARPHRRRRAQRRAAAHDRRDLHRVRAATPPTSPTGRTSSTTGSGSRTCPRSGSGSRRSACPPPRPAATPRASCSARRSPGIAADEIIDPHARRSTRSSSGTSATRSSPTCRASSRPRSRGQQDVAHEVNDIVVRRRRAPRARARLRPVGRRRPVHQPDARPAARRLGAAGRGARRVGGGRRRSSATTATAGCATAARLKFLVADWGIEEFREVLEEEYLEPHADRRPGARACPTGPIDHVGVHQQRDGRYYVGVAPIAGRVSGTMLDAGGRRGRARRVATGCGSPRTRSSIVLDVADDSGRAADHASSSRLGLQAGPSPWRRGTMACTGIEFCKLAIVETKERASRCSSTSWSSGSPTSTAARRADHDQHQRLPELLRPHPGRRHRAQGQLVTDGDGQPGRGLPGAPGRRPRARQPGSAASCAASR